MLTNDQQKHQMRKRKSKKKHEESRLTFLLDWSNMFFWSSPRFMQNCDAFWITVVHITPLSVKTNKCFVSFSFHFRLHSYQFQSIIYIPISYQFWGGIIPFSLAKSDVGDLIHNIFGSSFPRPMVKSPAAHSIVPIRWHPVEAFVTRVGDWCNESHIRNK